MRRQQATHGFELNRTTFPEFRDAVVAYEKVAPDSAPRSYPGYPRVELSAVKARLLSSLDRTLIGRRSATQLGTEMPSRRELSRLLRFSHGVFASRGRGPVPSAGGLHALELYCAVLGKSWLAAGAYHYDRSGHYLSRICDTPARDGWSEMIPSLRLLEGGAVIWIMVGDCARTEAKYLERGRYFLSLEAGHLMQNLCLLSASVGLTTVPLGGFFESEIADALQLPPEDAVLYLGLCGEPLAT